VEQNELQKKKRQTASRTNTQEIQEVTMADRPIAAYPGKYTPGDLDIRLEMSFTDLEGNVRKSPNLKVVTGDVGTWELRFENLHGDLGPGTTITLVRFNYQIASDMPSGDPRKRDYCSLRKETQAELELVTWKDSVNLLSVIVNSGQFKKGDSFTVRVGDRTGGSAGTEVFWTATDGTFLIAVDENGSGEFVGALGNPYEFEAVAHSRVELLRLLGPSVAKTGEPFSLHLGVFDRNRNLIEPFAGKVNFHIPDGIVGLPDAYAFGPEDEGLKIFENVSAEGSGVYRISVSEAASDEQFTSNPTLVSDEPKEGIYWGDVHAHGWGDSTMHLMHNRTKKLDPVSRHVQGRDIGRFDFACPAAMSMDPDKREQIWEPYRQACKKLDEPGKYVPFLAYEAHPKAGDRQVIFKNYETEPEPPPMRTEMEDIDQTYGNRDDVLLQVHIGGNTPLWDVYQPKRERFLEVCSGFGSAEWLLQKGLQLGYRPAVCGASDLHLGLMGGPRAVETFRGRFGPKYPMQMRDSAYGTGPVTAIIAPDLTRDALWDSIESRHTYATSGSRILLTVTGNGLPSGSDVDLKDTLEIDIRCHACEKIEAVELIIGEHLAETWHPDSLDFLKTVSLTAEEVPGAWAYVRVSQKDGEYAWSTPLYIHREGPLPSSDLPAWNLQESIELDPGAPNEATPYLSAVLEYLALEENPARFVDITPVQILDLSMGKCAQFYCHWSDESLPMSIRWFFEFDIPKIRYDLGWRDYGAFDENELGPKMMAKYNR